MVLIGIANGAFGTLGAVFGPRPIFCRPRGSDDEPCHCCGALIQIPHGRLSDRMDRRLVLPRWPASAHWRAGFSRCSSPAMSWSFSPSCRFMAPPPMRSIRWRPRMPTITLAGELCEGVGRAVAALWRWHDHRADDRRSGHGSVRPLCALRHHVVAHVAITIYAVIRSRVRAPVPASDRDAYLPLGHITVKTPESFNLSPLAGGTADEGQGGDRHGKGTEEKAA